VVLQVKQVLRQQRHPRSTGRKNGVAGFPLCQLGEQIVDLGYRALSERGAARDWGVETVYCVSADGQLLQPNADELDELLKLVQPNVMYRRSHLFTIKSILLPTYNRQHSQT
jgi:hypothetical protein